MRFIYCCQTDVGTIRKNNQDCLVIKRMNLEKYSVVLAAVCDGVGGLGNGELASRKTADMISAWFDYELPQIMVQADIESTIRYRLYQLICDINKEIYYSNCRRRISSATTLSVLIVWDYQYIIGHVGDSRIYKIDGTIKQLTKDHSWVAREVALKRMTEEEALADSRKNIILKCIGAKPDVAPDILFDSVRGDTVFILCTDGFWHYVKPGEWSEFFLPSVILSEKSLSQNLYNIAEQVKIRGESDNITAIGIKIF